jgi:hypothetical protein
VLVDSKAEVCTSDFRRKHGSDVQRYRRKPRCALTMSRRHRSDGPPPCAPPRHCRWNLRRTAPGLPGLAGGEALGCATIACVSVCTAHGLCVEHSHPAQSC